MRRSGCRINIIIIIGYICILSLIIPDLTCGNPIPDSSLRRGKNGGSPIPILRDDYNQSTYLMEEIIKIELHEDHADVEAEYTFYDTDPESDEIEICLPFANRPREVRISSDGYPISFSWSYIEYESLSYHMTWDQRPVDLYCLQFKIPIRVNVPTAILVTYKRGVYKYDYNANSYVEYEYSYLVGSGRYWNHPIARAKFEFTMSKDLYDRGASNSWNISENGNNIIFTREYHNWTPDFDFITLSWVEERGSMEETMRSLENLWNDPDDRPIIIAFSGVVLFLIVVSVVLSVYLLVGKKRRKNKN